MSLRIGIFCRELLLDINTWPFQKEIHVAIFCCSLDNISGYRCLVRLFFNLILESWYQGKELGLEGASPAQQILFFPQSKNPVRIKIGALNNSPKKKQECSSKIGLQIEDYLQIGKMADVFWARALSPTKLGVNHITFFPDLVYFQSNCLK